ncbi:MAG: hypothetical protein IT285_13170, partial [Bdellovibrionales bacterium]|nr:hypothetical protein [Bdellovibrionales bacterium]
SFQRHAAVYSLDPEAPGAAKLIEAARKGLGDKQPRHVTVELLTRKVGRIDLTPDPSRATAEAGKR